MFYLTIIPRARMGSESIAHEAEGAIDSEAMRARGIIVLVKYRKIPNISPSMYKPLQT